MPANVHFADHMHVRSSPSGIPDRHAVHRASRSFADKRKPAHSPALQVIVQQNARSSEKHQAKTLKCVWVRAGPGSYHQFSTILPRRVIPDRNSPRPGPKVVDKSDMLSLGCCSGSVFAAEVPEKVALWVSLSQVPRRIPARHMGHLRQIRRIGCPSRCTF